MTDLAAGGESEDPPTYPSADQWAQFPELHPGQYTVEYSGVPSGAPPQQQDPYRQDPFRQDPFQLDRFRQDPVPQDPVPRDPFQLDPFQQNPFQRDPFQEYASQQAWQGSQAVWVGPQQGYALSQQQGGAPQQGSFVAPPAQQGVSGATLGPVNSAAAAWQTPTVLITAAATGTLGVTNAVGMAVYGQMHSQVGYISNSRQPFRAETQPTIHLRFQRRLS